VNCLVDGIPWRRLRLAPGVEGNRRKRYREVMPVSVLRDHAISEGEISSIDFFRPLCQSPKVFLLSILLDEGGT
jgi:hypothetical protein